MKAPKAMPYAAVARLSLARSAPRCVPMMNPGAMVCERPPRDRNWARQTLMTKIISCNLDMHTSALCSADGESGGGVPSLLDGDGGGYETLNPFSLKESGEVGLRSSDRLRLLSFSTSLNSPVSLLRASTYQSQTVMFDFFNACCHSSCITRSLALYVGFL